MPRNVRAAALLLVAYGVLAVVNATILQVANGWSDPADLARAGLRLLGAGLLAGGLVRGRRWAWWISVIVGGLWMVLAVVAAVLFATTDALEYLPLPALSVTLLAASVALLGGALALLLAPSARAAFRRPRAVPDDARTR